MLGGVLMWIPGSMMYLVAALILIAQKLGAEEDAKPAFRSGSPAPGLEKPDGPATPLEETV
jgi:cytochrome c oxidase assembly factor CtaG